MFYLLENSQRTFPRSFLSAHTRRVLLVFLAKLKVLFTQIRYRVAIWLHNHINNETTHTVRALKPVPSTQTGKFKGGGYKTRIT